MDGRGTGLSWTGWSLVVGLGLGLALGSLAGAAGAASQALPCADCHNNRDILRSLSPRWREVYVDAAKYALDKHGALECVACHGAERYSTLPHPPMDRGLRDPATPARVRESCGQCHAEITERHLKSLHSTLDGHRLSLVSLLGEKEGMSRFAGCRSCHATCTHCHMKQPDRYGRLVSSVESHRFTRQPRSTVCKVCHGQTGETFLGVPGDARHGPSLMAAAGMECTSCHSESEVHGSGERPGYIAETTKPACEACHRRPGTAVNTPRGLLTPKQYRADHPAHRLHAETVNCVTCHTRWYTNCWDCHRGKAREERDKIFLAVNPMTGKIHTAVHSPINWDLGGVAPEVGGWAVKTRHSWGRSHACERCHTDPTVFVTAAMRQGKFVGVWGAGQRRATFVHERRVRRIVFDPQALQQSAHAGIGCLDCHAKAGDEPCAACHPAGSGPDRLRAPFEETARSLRGSREILRGSPGGLDPSWPQRWEALWDEYTDAAHEFHARPADAQRRLAATRKAAAEYDTALRAAIVRPRP